MLYVVEQIKNYNEFRSTMQTTLASDDLRLRLIYDVTRWLKAVYIVDVPLNLTEA